jgi:hypothetical protein
MLLAGIKFGIGFWMGTSAVMAAVFLLVVITDQIQKHRTRHEENPLKSGRRRLKHALWMSAPEPEREVRDVGGKVVFRTVILWRDADQRERRRKEPQYRQ